MARMCDCQGDDYSASDTNRVPTFPVPDESDSALVDVAYHLDY